MKMAIIISSKTGTTEKVAQWMKIGMESVGNTSVRIFNLEECDVPDKEYIESCCCIMFGTPTYLANMSWTMKKWFDTRMDYDLSGKLGAAFATENSPFGGGGELAVTTLHQHMLVKGMLVYSSGCAFGQPFIHIGPTIVRSELENRKELCIIFGQLVAQKAHDISH